MCRRHVLLTVLLDRRITKRAKDSVDASLVAGPLLFEPLKNILVDAKRNRGLQWQRLQTPSDDSANNVANVRLRVFVSGGRAVF